jgi:hypothetical protein
MNINNSPTEKQIAFAEAIANTLGIDFPTCSAEYTKLGYQQFIRYYYAQWVSELAALSGFYDDEEMAWWDPFAEGGY